MARHTVLCYPHYSRSELLSFLRLDIIPLYVTGFYGGSVVKNLLANAGDSGSTAGSGRSPGEGNGIPFQYSYLENPMDRAWWATVRGIAELDMTVHMLHCILFIHSSVSGYLGCFHSLVIANNTAMNMGVQTAFWVAAFNSFGNIPRSEIAWILW